MTIQTITSNEKALALVAGAINKNIEKREKTREAYERTVGELRAVSQAQSERIQVLEAALQYERHAHLRDVTVLRGELSAKAAWDASLEMATPQERELLCSYREEEECYRNVGSCTCCLSLESFRAHLKADWEPRKNRIPYRHFLRLFLEQLELSKVPGPIAQAANDCLIEWFPNSCSNLKTWEETMRRKEEQACYDNVGSFTCCRTFDSLRAHLRADWELRKDRIPYRYFLRFFLEQLEQSKVPGPIAQAANDCLIEWFPNSCSNLKTYEETRNL